MEHHCVQSVELQVLAVPVLGGTHVFEPVAVYPQDETAFVGHPFPPFVSFPLADKVKLVFLHHFAKVDDGIAHSAQCRVDADAFFLGNLAV